MIRLINYGYKDWKVGDIIDLGEIKNESMISMGRAVAVETPTKKVKVKPKKKVGKKQTKNNDNNNNRSDKQKD